MYDSIIIGTGPAGISAALTLKSLNKNFLLIGSKTLSDKINKAHLIRNYPGLPMVSGKEMYDVFYKQLADMEIEITELQVTGVYHSRRKISVLCNDQMFETKTVILATGVESIKPTVGEIEGLGIGVSYCATCDGFLYKDKTIAVVSTSKEFEHELKYLSDIAGKVYYTPIYPGYENKFDNVDVVVDKVEKINIDKKVTGITYKNKGDIAVDGVFMLKNALSPHVLVPGIEVSDGHIVVDRQCRTNLKGIFACGDCTGRPYQYTKAVGEGNVCAHSAVAYIEEV